MGGKRRTSEEIAHVLAQAEAGVPVKELCRKYGVSEATFYVWRKKFGGLAPSELKRLKQLEEENRKRKRLVADLALDKQILQDAVSGKPCGFARRSRKPPLELLVMPNVWEPDSYERSEKA